MVAIACIGYLYGLPDTKRPFLVLLFATTAEPLPRAAAGVRPRLGHRRQRVGHGHRAGAQLRGVPRHRGPAPARRRAAPPQRGAVGDVGGAEGRRPHRAAHRRSCWPRSPWPPRRPHGWARRSWPATRSPRRCSCSWPSRVDMFKVSGQSLVGPRARRRPARRGARRRRPPLRLGVARRHRAHRRDARRCRRCCRGSSPTTPTWSTRAASRWSCSASCSCRLPSPSSPTASSWAPTTSATCDGRRRSRSSSSLPVFVAVMVRPSLGIVTVWLGVLVCHLARALKNHTRVQGDAWMASAERRLA